MSVIFCFSSQTATESSGVSVSFTAKMLSFLSSELSEETAHTIAVSIDFFVRKLAHFTIYAVLGFLVRNLLIYAHTNRKIIFSVIVCAIYSITDEVHQIFVPGRAGRVYDVAIDTFGATTGVLMFVFVMCIIEKIGAKKVKKHPSVL